MPSIIEMPAPSVSSAEVGGLSQAIQSEVTPLLAQKAEKNHSHSVATLTSAGFMSAEDKKKINDCPSVAQVNQKADKDHSHSNVTSSTAGFMSAADKAKLDKLTVDTLQNLTSQVTQNTTCRKLTVTRFGKIVTLSIQSQQKSWASGQTVITLPTAAKPAGELDIPFVMGAQGQGVFRIRTDGVCLCAAVSTSESKSIMTTVTYLAAN